MSGYEKRARAIHPALDEAINGVINDLEMLAHRRDLVTGDKIETVHARRIASAAHDALSKAWNDAALEEAPAEFIDPNSRNFKEGFSVGQIVGRDQVRSQYPPCLQCGAETASQAETMCCMAGDEDNCHGCELWTEDERINSATPAVANDVLYADADALIAHLDELVDDNGQGGDKWGPAQAAIAGIRAWQSGHEAAVKRVADALSAQGWATGGDDDEFLDDVRAAMTLALAQPQGREAVDLEQFREAVELWKLEAEIAGMGLEVPDQRIAEANRLLALIDAQSAKGDGDA